jgi:hypothetical protein
MKNEDSKNTTPNNGPAFDQDELPEGFEPLSSRQVDGWFQLEPGNKVQGFLLAKVSRPSNFNKGEDQMFVKIQITNGTTKTLDGEKKVKVLVKGEVVGLDVKGYLSALKDTEEGREVFVKYKGLQKKEDVKKGMSPAHLFTVAAVPV